MPTLLLALKSGVLSEPQVARIRSAAPQWEVAVAHERQAIESILDDVEIAVGNFPRDLLPRARRLQWFQQWSAGADWLLQHPAAVEADFVLTTASGVHAVPISEHVLATMFAFARNLPQAFRDQREGKWNPIDRCNILELAGKCLLLIGVGAIGERIARTAAALEMKVVGVRRDPALPASGPTAVHAATDLPDLLPSADFVVLTVPLTNETRGLIGASELKKMKRSSYLINVGRGGTVRQTDLFRALQEGRIAGAALDVFEEEPLPRDSPLWSMPNVIVTSHYSGATPHYDERALAILLDNLDRYQQNVPLRNVVDKERGY